MAATAVSGVCRAPASAALLQVGFCAVGFVCLANGQRAVMVFAVRVLSHEGKLNSL